MRAIQIVVWLAALVMVCLPWLRRPQSSSRTIPTPTDELVKDPICQTYVARSRAITRRGPEGPRYFCSDACARRDA
jgi:hypothetical protein